MGRLDRCWGFLSQGRVLTRYAARNGERKRKFTIKLCHCLMRKEFTWLIFLASSHIDALTCA